jgi:hypothetical protein
MTKTPCECLGYYDFDKVVLYARKKFIEGDSTINLLKTAKTQKERDEVTLIAFLDLDMNKVKEISLHCRYSKKCTVKNCLQIFKEMIESEVGKSHS